MVYNKSEQKPSLPGAFWQKPETPAGGRGRPRAFRSVGALCPHTLFPENLRHPQGKRARSRAMGKHGASPHTPVDIRIGAVRGENACGGQRMREHLPSGKLAGGFACGADRFRSPVIRVSRAELASSASSSFEYCSSQRRAHHVRAFAS